VMPMCVVPGSTASCAFGRLPNAQLAVLPGTTHMGITRRSEQLLAFVTPFLEAS